MRQLRRVLTAVSAGSVTVTLLGGCAPWLAADPQFGGNLVLGHAGDVVKPARPRGVIQGGGVAVCPAHEGLLSSGAI